MAVPFALGIAISKVLFHKLMSPDPEFQDVSFTAFFVFIGTAMAITAFPVLARILQEGGLIYTRAGTMAMGAAAMNDAVAWCLLILAISIANNGQLSNAVFVFLATVGFALFLFFVFRPFFEKLCVLKATKVKQ
jgi:Kef-type K+ transport system membrane component KefB